jgi:hypothetical protein
MPLEGLFRVDEWGGVMLGEHRADDSYDRETHRTRALRQALNRITETSA